MLQLSNEIYLSNAMVDHEVTIVTVNELRWIKKSFMELLKIVLTIPQNC